jgi:hypothetical protein
MSHAGSPEPVTHSSQEAFPAAEVERFHTADRQAASHIIGLMGGIFTIGLLLYATVCWLVHIGF